MRPKIKLMEDGRVKEPSVYIGWRKVVAGFCSAAGKKDSHKTRLLVKYVDLWFC